MSSDPRRTAREIFDELADRPAQQRPALLEAACRGDEVLRDRVLKLLRADHRAGDFLEKPAILAADLAEDHPPPKPRQIGRYQVTGVIATGGMGTVYEAQQEQPRRTVALKVMRWSIASPSAQRRFEYESELLARLQHPGIAQVFEAGTHQCGTEPVPYFAMEYIPEAKSITEYADQENLDLRQRLELLGKVCDAVEYAHQKGIIHRDLKPSNILVDAQGQPRVIDFGVARSTDTDPWVTGLRTQTGQLIGTLQYMSPEQCAADPHNIDTRSDVYTLGVVLYELLCGKLPYDVTSVTLHEATRIVRDQPPSKLSTIDARLRGDLETIVQKALEKDREHRYRSAAELADDVRRYLAGEAILARPPSVTYQLRVFARRHKALVAGFAAVFVSLTLGILGTSLGLIQARQQRDAADAALIQTDRQRAESETATGLLSSVLEAVDPEIARGRDVTVLKDVLDEVARRIETDAPFADQSLAEATLRTTIGKTYRHLGLYDQADPHLRTALEIRRSVLGNRHPDVVESLFELGLLQLRNGNPNGVVPLCREAVEIYRSAGLTDSPAVAGSLRELGTAQMAAGDYAQAESLLQGGLQMYRKLPGNQARGISWCLNNLGMLEQRKGDLDAAAEYHLQALELRRKELGADHPHIIHSYINLGDVQRSKVDSDQSEKWYRLAIELSEKVRGEHPSTAGALQRLGVRLHKHEGDCKAAEPLLRRSLEIRQKAFGDGHRSVATMRLTLGHCLRDQGKIDEAERLFGEAAETFRTRRLEKDPWLGGALMNLGYCHTRMGRYAEAEPELLEGYRIKKAVHEEGHPLLVEATQRLVGLYEAWEKPEQAAQWRARLPEEPLPADEPLESEEPKGIDNGLDSA